MDMLVPRIRFYHELKNHAYFFKNPDLRTEISAKLRKKAFTHQEKALSILKELFKRLEEQDELTKEILNKTCSIYIYECHQKDDKIKNEEVFSLLRYVITGNPVGPPLGEILDVIGKKTFLD